MNKLKQIEALVEEVFIQLGIVTRNAKEKKILVDFGRKCAEIDEEDWEESSHAWIGDTIKEYNTRLRGDEKEELHPAIQHVNVEGELTPEIVKAINKLAEVAYNTPIKPALQPLPEKMPDDFLGEFTMSSSFRQKIYDYVIQHFGTPPRAWWMDLKKGNKFMYGKNAYELDAILLRTVNDYTYNIDNCSPYTDPEAQLRKTLNPEQIKLLDEMKANTKV
jgi:hypothetical protein